jgi:GAF domain-containing protein
VSEDALSEALAALSSFVVSEATLGDTLQRVAEVAKGAVGAADVAGITLVEDGRSPRTVVYTDRRSPETDAGQYEDGTGPCLDAYKEKRVVEVADTGDVGDRWPSFSRAAQEQGILSTLSLPLVVAGDGIGALNLYSTRLSAFDDRAVGVGTALATQAAVVLANASAYWSAFELSEQLNEAMQSRATIEQAKGILMAQSGVSADEAFALLRKASQRENAKVREIAERILARARKPKA